LLLYFNDYTSLSAQAFRMIHILVLEDDAKLNQLVCTYLNDCGFEAKGCLNANAAYDEMYNALYDLIISDKAAHNLSVMSIKRSTPGKIRFRLSGLLSEFWMDNRRAGARDWSERKNHPQARSKNRQQDGADPLTAAF